MIRIYLISLLILLSTTILSAQRAGDSEMAILYKKAQVQMENKEYDKANESFRQILKLGTKLPAEMPYLFAETLYYIEQYQNSKSFLDKYFEIMGKAGNYYDNALILEEKLDKELNKAVSCQFCDYAGYRLNTCKVCKGEKQILQSCNRCMGTGKLGCSICAGDGVIVQLGALGDRRYKTCHKCKGEGIHTCGLCEGEKEFYNYCSNCLGRGSISTTQICDHKPK